MPVPKRVVKKVDEEIQSAFARLRQRFFGGGDKQLRIGWSPYEGLGGLYRLATESQGGIAEKETQQGLEEIAESYLAGVQARLKSDILAALGAAMRATNGEETDLGTKLSELWDKATSDVERVIDTEAQRARQTGSVDGIVQASAAMGIDDPTVYWVVVRDAKLCDECKKLHLLDDETTPRVWKLSEVGAGYHQKGDDDPKHNGLHPHCRCTITTLPPGFGFTKAGMIQYREPGYDEYASQRA